MSEYIVRKFNAEDAEEVSMLVARTLREVNRRLFKRVYRSKCGIPFRQCANRKSKKFTYVCGL